MKKNNNTQKKISLYNSKIKDLKSQSDLVDVKDFLRNEWRKIKKKGKK